MTIYQYRQSKDTFFKTDPHAPVAQRTFSGLRYFPVSQAYIVRASFKRVPPEPVLLLTSSGDEERYYRYAKATFTLAEQELSLRLFAKDTVTPDQLFIPFKDLTNGQETYDAGRYLDIAHPKKATFMLDFNYAYNPYCAYSDRYRCPLPPRDNHLTIAIRAGERSYQGAANL
jgi:uncharacterized protein (DUF1684 family)